jgi:2-polyprenyl-3-methyl-5-hydroxy-6-metoxy-1,4-benzoquinol methylase
MAPFPLELYKQYNIVLLLAILEHLNGTPRFLLEKVRSVMKEDGALIVEVPNVGELSNRLNFIIKGQPPFPPIEDYYYSNYPFTGHNREYTIREMVYCLEQSNFRIKKLITFDHSSYSHKSTLRLLLRWVEKLGPPEWRPNLWVLAAKK